MYFQFIVLTMSPIKTRRPYSIGMTKFQELAKEAGAVYKVDKLALVNCEIFEKFLETFREF